jgi:hypothetical protein
MCYFTIWNSVHPFCLIYATVPNNNQSKNVEVLTALPACCRRCAPNFWVVIVGLSTESTRCLLGIQNFLIGQLTNWTQSDWLTIISSHAKLNSTSFYMLKKYTVCQVRSKCASTSKHSITYFPSSTCTSTTRYSTFHSLHYSSHYCHTSFPFHWGYPWADYP